MIISLIQKHRSNLEVPMSVFRLEQDVFIKFFGIADKLRDNVLHTTTTRKNVALMESLTVRQQKAIMALLLLTENNPEGINLKKLAERLNMTVPATSILVESMVQNKIFCREPSKEDRRAVKIRLSDFGMSLINSFRIQMDAYLSELYKDISDEEKEVFSKVINHFYANIFHEEMSIKKKNEKKKDA